MLRYPEKGPDRPLQRRTARSRQEVLFFSTQDNLHGKFTSSREISKIHCPKRSLLRLDADQNASTNYGLTHLFPILFMGGVPVTANWGHWRGSQRACEEHFEIVGSWLKQLWNLFSQNERPSPTTSSHWSYCSSAAVFQLFRTSGAPHGPTSAAKKTWSRVRVLPLFSCRKPTIR
jgi:hypothetical protein